MRGTLGTILIATLMLLMIYRRFKKLRMRHRLRPLRMVLRIALWILLGGWLMVRWASAPLLTGALAAGSVLGAFALAHVEFERSDERTFYKSNSYIGTIVFALFTARVLWRTAERLLLGQPLGARRLAGAEAPEGTLLLLFVVIGYSVCYTAGILIRSRTPA